MWSQSSQLDVLSPNFASWIYWFARDFIMRYQRLWSLNLFSHTFGGWQPKIKSSSWLPSLSWACRWLPSCSDLMWLFIYVCVNVCVFLVSLSVSQFCFIRTPSQVGLGLTVETLLWLNCLWKALSPNPIIFGGIRSWSFHTSTLEYTIQPVTQNEAINKLQIEEVR